MDSLDLLARENEFKKLNNQLEKKTQSLIKEIEHAMQKQDIFSEFSPSLTLTPVHIKKKHSCGAQRKISSPHPQQKDVKKIIRKSSAEFKKKSEFENRSVSTEYSTKFVNGTARTSKQIFENDKEDFISSLNCEEENVKEQNKSRIICDCCVNNSHIEDIGFLYAFVSVNVKDKVLPQSFLKGRPTVESVCKFLSSKLKLMQEQIDSLQDTLDKKVNKCNLHLTQLAERESERLTLLNKCNNMKSSTADMKAKYTALLNKCDEKERLYIEQRGLADKLSCELKQLRTRNLSVEAKCATLQNSLELLTQQLETANIADKEFRNSTRSLSASHQNTISRLESQLEAQAAHMDKQMALIDNLRRQNVLLSTEAAVKGLENEYCDYLQKDF